LRDGQSGAAGAADPSRSVGMDGLAARGRGVLGKQVEFGLVRAARGGSAVAVDRVGGLVAGEELIVTVHSLHHVGTQAPAEGVVAGAANQKVVRRPADER